MLGAMKCFNLMVFITWRSLKITILGWSPKKCKVFCVLISFYEMGGLENKCYGHNYDLQSSVANLLFGLT